MEYFWRSLHPDCLNIKPLATHPANDLVIEINPDHTAGAVYQLGALFQTVYVSTNHKRLPIIFIMIGSQTSFITGLSNTVFDLLSNCYKCLIHSEDEDYLKSVGTNYTNLLGISLCIHLLGKSQGSYI